jgi:hypothetical protein
LPTFGPYTGRIVLVKNFRVVAPGFMLGIDLTVHTHGFLLSRLQIPPLSLPKYIGRVIYYTSFV